MQLRHAPLALLLGLACVRENPGFIIDHEGSGSGGSTTDDPTTSTTDATTTATTTTTTTATATATTDLTTTTATATSSTTDPPAPLCDDYFPDVGLGLTATINDQPIDQKENPSCEPRIFTGTGGFTDGLLLNLNNCENGVVSKQDLFFTSQLVNNLDLQVGDCFTIILAWQPDCVTLRSAVIYAVADGFGPIAVPIGIAVSGSELPPAGLDVLGPTLEPVPGGSCSCDGPCPDCGDGRPPGALQLRFNDADASVLGAGAMVAGADFGLVFFGFDVYNLRSHAHPACGPEHTHLDWYAFIAPLAP